VRAELGNTDLSTWFNEAAVDVSGSGDPATPADRAVAGSPREVAVGVKVMLVPDSAQPHVITADILRFPDMSLKVARK
jgi:hypothetical protein